MSMVALALRGQACPTRQLINGNPTSNYVSPNLKQLSNFSTTHRIDYVIASPKDVLTLTGAYGRQVSNAPVGLTNSTSNLGPLPYNYGQAYAPKTYVGIIDETHVFSPHLINQLKVRLRPVRFAELQCELQPALLRGALRLQRRPGGPGLGSVPERHLQRRRRAHRLRGLCGHGGHRQLLRAARQRAVDPGQALAHAWAGW